MRQPSEIAIPTSRGNIHGLLQRSQEPVPVRGSVLAVGGYTGGTRGPADDAYGALGAELPARGIAMLRLDYRVKREPGPVEEGLFDVHAGIDWLVTSGLGPVVAVGFSFGGALVVRAGVASPHVVAVAAIATQTAGMGDVRELAPKPLLLVHGTADLTLSPDLSRQVWKRAGEPKALHLLEGASHSLRERREQLLSILLPWIDSALPGAA